MILKVKININGQELTDHHDHIFFTVYNVRWYVAPLHVQKLILFLLQRSSRTLVFQLGGMFDLSLEFFATVKESLEELQHVYNELEDESEIAIVEKYGESAKRITALIVFLHLCNTIVFMSLSILPYTPGIVFINDLLLRRLLQSVMPVYYVNEEKYFYLLVLHLNAAIQIGGTAIVATGTLLLGYFKHACGMFRIASYRIEKALMINMVKNNGLKNEIVDCKEIIFAVDIHRKTVKLVFIY
ncbi:PREDICTED: uncharacterized protein LOC105454564 [Wasmannia auropunctata]|uniref:uncharacterized protein LOC105454564 n=1 Tax=Wasmannia auropunctata TaxID=64793 RepID=UPI0005F0428B|nr:PREDICTED: uncharacterized protein LOC105454564 [Wasmannia auropunctata]